MDAPSLRIRGHSYLVYSIERDVFSQDLEMMLNTGWLRVDGGLVGTGWERVVEVSCTPCISEMGNRG
jgi:hypothetical protein